MFRETEAQIRAILFNDPERADRVIKAILDGEQMWKAGRREKQLAGIEAARRRNVRIGRPPTPLPSYFGELYAKVQAGELTKEAAARLLGVSSTTFRKKLKLYEEEKAALGTQEEQRGL